MSHLLRRPTLQSDGKYQDITPKNADWNYVGFSAYDLKQDQTLALYDADNETCLVLLSGKASVQAGDTSFEGIGKRMDVFEHTPPHAVYAPNDCRIKVTALTDLEIAVCRAPGNGNHSARLIIPSDMSLETRGQATNTRHVCNILPEDHPADSLLVVEVRTPSGHWSSYPPHKHDQDNLPEESYLEETYYHRLNPSQGFAFQRVYTEDGSLDETMAIHDKDVVLVPKGYHPVATAHGYDSYYLNVMAGPKRQWVFHNHPKHEWMMK